MKRVGKNSIAIGLVLALISVAMSFSAQGATTVQSHAEARYLQGTNGLGDVVQQVGGALEDNGAQACEPTVGTCDGQAFVTGPLDPLTQLTVPIGTALDLKLGAVNDYAEAGHTTPGTSRAAAGAVDDNGIIRTGASNNTPANATLDLTGNSLSGLSAITDLKFDLGAVSATAQLGQDESSLQRDYRIEGGTVTLQVPALADINTAIGGVLSATLADPLTLNATTVCGLLTAIVGLGGTVPIPPATCDAAAQIPGGVSGQITGLSSVTGGLTTVTQDGITFNFVTGAITIDLDAAIFAATGSHLNSLPPNTHLLEEILPKLVLNLPTLINSLHDDLIQQIIDNVSLSGTIGGVALPPLSLSALGEAGLSSALDQVFTGLSDGLTAIGDPLAPALVQIVNGLKPIIDIIVNVPDLYTTKGIVSGKSVSDVNTAAVANKKFYSETAVQLVLGGGALADLRLGTAQVGPNGSVTDNTDAPADVDVNADAVADADSQADAVTDADADSVADADVTSTLPNTGAPNMLPLLVLALGLIAFGTAVLVNEKRRLNTLS